VIWRVLRAAREWLLDGYLLMLRGPGRGLRG